MSSTLQCDKCHKSQKTEEEKWGRASMLGCESGNYLKMDLCKECSVDFSKLVKDFIKK